MITRQLSCGVNPGRRLILYDLERKCGCQRCRCRSLFADGRTRKHRSRCRRYEPGVIFNIRRCSLRFCLSCLSMIKNLYSYSRCWMTLMFCSISIATLPPACTVWALTLQLSIVPLNTSVLLTPINIPAVSGGKSGWTGKTML